jgi:hypothetical protein
MEGRGRDKGRGREEGHEVRTRTTKRRKEGRKGCV